MSWRQAATLAATFAYHDGQRRSLAAIVAQHEHDGAPAEADRARRALAQVPGPGKGLAP